MPVVFSLEYSRIACSKCGASDRIAGTACAECGENGRRGEVNAKVVRRREAIREVRRALKSQVNAKAEPLPYYTAVQGWRSQLGEQLGQVLIALGHVASDPHLEKNRCELIAAIWSLRGSCDLLSSLPSRRPFVGHLRSRKVAITLLLEMVDEYLNAFESETPIDAQRHAARAQQILDQATKSMEEAEEALELIEVYSDKARSEGYFASVLWLLSEVRPQLNLLETDTQERERLQLELGHPIASGQGAEAIVRRVIADAVLDPDRYNEVVRSALALFTSDDLVRNLAFEEGSLELIARARDAMVESLFTFDIAISRATSDHDRLRRLIGLYRELFEDGAAPIFAWYLRITSAKSASFNQLMLKDSTELLRSVKAHPNLADLFLGADGNIRNAASHGHAYKLVGPDKVLIKLRSHTETISVDVLIDLLLSLIESLLASLWTLDNELARLGFTEHNSGSTLRKESLLPIAVASLESRGMSVHSSEASNGRWWIRFERGKRLEPFEVSYSIGSQMPDDVRAVSFHFPGLPEGHFEFSKSKVSEWIEIDNQLGHDKVAGLLTLLDASSLDGKNALNENQLRKASCLGAVSLLSNSDQTAIRLIRHCLHLASQRGELEVLEFCAESLRQWRAPEPARDYSLKQTILKWNAEPLPSLPRVSDVTVWV